MMLKHHYYQQGLVTYETHFLGIWSYCVQCCLLGLLQSTIQSRLKMFLLERVTNITRTATVTGCQQQQQEEQQQLGWTTVDFRGYILRGAGRGAGHEPIRSLNRWLLSELIQFDTILTIFLSKFTCHHGYWVYTSRLFWVNLLALLQSCCHFPDTLTSLVFSSCTCSYDGIVLVSVTVDIAYKKGYGIILLYLIMMIQDDFQVLSLSLLAKFWVKNGYTNVRCEWSH